MNAPPLEPLIRREFVEFMLKKFGYTLSDERMERVSRGMGAFMDIGYWVPEAYAEALNLEFASYGEPRRRVSHDIQ